MRFCRVASSLRMAWTAAVCVTVVLAAVEACSNDATRPIRSPTALRPRPDILLPSDTPGNAEVWSLPLADTDLGVGHLSLDTFTTNTLVQITVRGMIHAHNVPNEYADRDFGPEGWYSQTNVSIGGNTVFFGGVKDLSPQTGIHTADSVISVITVVNGAGYLVRGSGFLCDQVMPKNCWLYTYPNGPQTVSVKRLEVPIGMDNDNLARPVPKGTEIEFRWAYPSWALGVPYTIQSWTFYPDSGGDTVYSNDGVTRYKQLLLQVSGRMQVTVLINGRVDTASAYAHVYCATGDTALDNNPHLEAILDILDQEWHSADPNDSVKDNRREQAGWAYQNASTGNWDGWMNPAGGIDACDSKPGTAPGLADGSYAFFVHVHPFAPYEQLPGTNCPGRENHPYQPGPSQPDRDWLSQQVNQGSLLPSSMGIVMDSTNIYRFPVSGKPISVPRYNKTAACHVI